MTVTGQDIVDAARLLLGIWYDWWEEGDPIPQWWYEYGDTCPPRSWFEARGIMCFPGDTKVLARGVEKSYKRVYRGELVTIKTAGGKQLSGTPNHPVLSKRGWIPLNRLKKGDYVVSNSGLDVLASANGHEHDVPVSIQQVHRSLVDACPLERIAGSSFDFHGDGTDGNIDVVCPNGELENGIKPSLNKHVPKFALSFAHVPKFSLVGERSTNLELLGARSAARPIVGGFGFRSSRRGAHVGVSKTRRFGNTPTNVALLQPSIDDVLGDAEVSRDAALGLAGEVATNDFVGIHVEPLTGTGGPPYLDTGGLETLSDSRGANAESSGHGIGGFPSDVSLDKIVDIEVRAFCGDVYNLQTESGHYIANGIITHNCADLVNAARNYCGLPSIGGTPAYYDWAVANGGVDFDPSSAGVPGAICVNPGPWRGDTLLPQGHIAIYTDEHTLIQATDGVWSFAGVNEGEQDYESYGWAGYWTYALMPDVDYSGSLGDDAPEPGPALVKPRWQAIDKNDWYRKDGPDWAGGFHWYLEDGTLGAYKGPGEA